MHPPYPAFTEPVEADLRARRNGTATHTPLDGTRLRALLAAFRGRRVLVVGDCMLDEYEWGNVTRISPEAPVKVFEPQSTSYAAGGASNVATNIVALDGSASLISIVGDDAMGERLRALLQRQGVEQTGIVVAPGRVTTIKTRYIAQSHQLMRVDREERTPVSPEIAAQLVDAARRQIDSVDAVLFSDYLKGSLTEQVVSGVRDLARAAGKPLFANPKPGNIGLYHGFSLVSLNQSEAEAVTGLRIDDVEVIDPVGARLMERLGVEAAVITLGGRGLALFQAGLPPRYLPVVPLKVYDPCGCGDSAIAAAALARTGGADWVEAAALANLAGNAKVRKLGVVPVTCKEIESVWLMGHAGSGAPAGPEPAEAG